MKEDAQVYEVAIKTWEPTNTFKKTLTMDFLKSIFISIKFIEHK